MTTITTLDANWMGRPHSIAAALLEAGGRYVVVDPGPGSTLPALREHLRTRGISFGDLEAVLLTHIHLDHAGATGALVRENPRLAVYVHKNGAPHMMDPAKLLASAGRLWGDQVQVLFGDALPVPQENLRVLEGGETLALGGRKVEVAYTPGHASHHVTYFDDGVAFVGDTAGIHIENGSHALAGAPSYYVLPATPPPDIDLGLWDASFAAILAQRPDRLFLTHYGFAEKPAAHIAQFRERLHRWAALTEEVIRNSPDEAAAMNAFVAKFRAEMDQELGTAEAEHHAFTAGLNLSFLGLARYLRKKSKASA